MYIVTKPFYDLQDVTKADHTKDGDIPREFWLYKAGDVYPREGAIPPSEQRIRELASDGNKQGTPLIAWVEPEPELPQSDAEPEPESTPEPAPEPASEPEPVEEPAKAEEPAEPKKPAKKPAVKAPAKRPRRTTARKKGT